MSKVEVFSFCFNFYILQSYGIIHYCGIGVGEKLISQKSALNFVQKCEK